MKIAYLTPYKDEASIVRELLPNDEIIFYNQPITDSIPVEIKDVEVLSIFVDSRVNKEMMDAMPNLKHIALRSTGYDHIDFKYAKEKGIAVSYVPHYGSQTVAEHAFALMLALSRKVFQMYDLLRSRGDLNVEEHEGFDLCGKTIGVIGTGAIGKRVCEIAKGFRMNVYAYDLYPDLAFAEKLGVKYGTLDEVFAVADILSLHVPATPENHYLLNETSIAKIKPGAYIINTARGPLIDTIALIHALKSGHLAGAGLDVYEGEEFLKDELKLIDTKQEFNMQVWRAFAAEHELLDMQNVIMTPHMAFNTKEAKREITETTIENIVNWRDQKEFASPPTGE
jgi:D-lactate dehydrogenase